MEKTTWDKTTNRFVAYFDILGFKELVLKNTHGAILEKLQSLKRLLRGIENDVWQFDEFKPFDIADDQTKSITFSDSIIVFSKEDQYSDFAKILIDAYFIHSYCIENKIPMKGALSYGEITVDFDNSLFFGQPIIDAYLLHEELQMLTVIADHNFEIKASSYGDIFVFDELFFNYKANLKCGRISHRILKPQKTDHITKHIAYLKKFYETVSGRPRIYVDNTLEFLHNILKEN